MISKEQIMNIIQQKVEEENYFVVDVEVKTSNKIIVHLDGDQGVPIDFCVSVSRLIEHTLDRETEDFELEVSSPGIGQPFKVHRQFK
jgi:ribosome maturation factor RimP